MKTENIRPAATTHVYVSPLGNDAWSGARARPTANGTDGPVRSLAAARTIIRRMKHAHRLPAGGISVEIAPGIYPLTASFVLTAEDSGTAVAPITYQSTDGDARIIGGKVVSGFRPVTDPAILSRLAPPARKAVVELDLPAAGVTDYGHIAAGQTAPAQLELYFDGRPMQLAEWPNGKWATIVSVPAGKRIVDSSGKRRGTSADRFQYPGDRPSHWKSFDDVWLHGYWFVDWRDEYLRVKDIDTATHTVIIGSPQSRYGYKKGQRFRFLNVLEELDEPGEYYLDRKTGKLYFWPPSDISKHTAMVSLLDQPLVSLRQASHVRFVGLTFECSRADGIVIDGGEDDLVAGCDIRDVGGTGVNISGGHGNRVQSCNLYYLGEGGITMQGGDRQTLAPGGHVAENNDIHDFALWIRTYRVGIRMGGVGLRASHNFIHNAPHAGILYQGNDHIIEYNQLSRLCTDTGDVGAIYTGRDWSARGTIIRYNYIHDLGGVNMGSNAIYLDDLASGQTIIGNVIRNVWRAMMIGGGRDNLVENNIFARYRIGIHFDCRGIGWSRKLIEGRKGGWDMFGRLEAVPYNKPPYSTKYPGLANIMNENPLEPKNNRIVRNIFVGPHWLDTRGFTMQQAEERGWAHFENNLTGGDPGFVDAKAGDFHLRPDSPARKLGFQEIPFAKIGLQVDKYRKNAAP